MQLLIKTSIASFTVQECTISSKFTFPPSTRTLSKVYELSCTYEERDDYSTTAAEITVPYASEGRFGLSFFQASRAPTYLCDLSPVYCFDAVKGGLFNSSQRRAKIEVKEFDCFICVCSQT